MSSQGQIPDNDGSGSQVEEVYTDEIKINQNTSICDYEEYNINKNLNMNENKNKNNKITETLTYKQMRAIRKRNNRHQQRKYKSNQKLKSDSHNMPKISTQCQYSNEDTTWGDELVISDGWKQQRDQDVFRVLHYNVNGITAENDFMEWETILQSLEDVQADVFSLNETKLDTRNSNTQHVIRQKAKISDPRMKLHINSSHQTPRVRQSIYKPGGTLMATRGHWTGRIVQPKHDSSQDSLGRWSVTHLQGKNNTIISIFSVYRVCPDYTGENTAYVQQQNDLYKRYQRIIDPRKQIVKDLQQVILKLIQQHHKVIINADINDDAGVEFTNQWNDMLKEVGMRNIVQCKHNNRSLPRTYDRGRRCLDCIAVSENIKNDDVIRCGILPFYSLSASDHRPIYVDFDTDALFDDVTPDLTNHTFKRFTTKNTYKCGKYVKYLTQYVQEAKLMEKIKAIQNEIKLFLKNLQKNGNEIGSEDNRQLEARQKIENKLQKLDVKRYQLMIAVERKCGIAPMKGMFWYSDKLREAAKQLSQIKRHIRWLHKEDADKIELQNAQEEKQVATKALREVQKDSRQYRDEMLDDLAIKCSKKWKMAKEAAVKIIKEAEKHSQIFSKINITIKDIERTGVRSILLPTESNPDNSINIDEDDQNDKWKEIRHIDEIYERILEQNAKMLLKSNNGMTAKGCLAKDIGADASNETFIQHILQGNIDAETISNQYPEYDLEAKEMLRQMQHDKRCKQMTWKFGSEEYRQLFNHTKESTSCGPSGLHMSHWKAATESDDLTFVHATLTWAAFVMGITYKRWNVSFHSMLQKMKKPYIHKLRIIQIFEGDMNGGMKYLFGRVFMKKLVQDGVIDSNAYGSIPGRDPLEALKVLQYLYDNHRLMKRDLVVIFNDAAGCYDRIRPNQAEICSRRVGCSTSLTKTHTSLQMNMVHHIKTAAGISKGIIKYNETDTTDINLSQQGGTTIREGNIGGVGQGGGASPVEWLVILIVLMNAFKAFSDGAKLVDPEGLFGGIIPVISFVDDNSITSDVPTEMTIDEIFHKAGVEMTHWKKLLNTTGGDLAVHKCTVTLMKWKWGAKNGQATLMSINDAPGTIIIEDNSNGRSHPIHLRRLEYNESEKQLGIIIPIDGSFHQEYQRRLTQSKTLGQQLYRSPLNHYESILVYKLYFIPKMEYPLSITQFTQKQCQEIQRQFYRYCLPKIGLNRNTPKALLFGPLCLGGFQLYDIYCAQIYQHVLKITQHIRRRDNVGKAFMSNMNVYSLLVGSATPFFHLSRARYMYVGEYNTTVYFLWKMNSIWKLNLHYTSQHCITQKYQNEHLTIMDDAAHYQSTAWNESKLKAINACRVYHGIVFPSDLLHYNRKYINKEYLFGRYCMRSETQKKRWPTQPLPTDGQWTVWREFITSKYTCDGSTKLAPHHIPTYFLKVPTTDEEQELQALYTDNVQNHPNSYYIHRLPLKYQSYIQEWEETNISIYDYWYQMTKNNIQIATDGSYQPDTMLGAGAAVMSQELDPDDTYICVGTKCSAVEGMTSLTAEQTGIICALLLMHIMCLRYGVPTVQCNITIWIDNEEALRRITTTPADDIRLKAYGVRDYGDLVLMSNLLYLLPTQLTLTFKKVKSHQDTPGHDMTYEERLNTLADEKANFST